MTFVSDVSLPSGSSKFLRLVWIANANQRQCTVFPATRPSRAWWMNNVTLASNGDWSEWSQPAGPQRQLPPLRPLTEGMVDENKMGLWPAAAYDWFARTKVKLHHAESAEAAAAALAEEDFAADATLV